MKPSDVLHKQEFVDVTGEKDTQQIVDEAIDGFADEINQLLGQKAERAAEAGDARLALLLETLGELIWERRAG